MIGNNIFQTLFEDSLVGIIILDKNGLVLRTNEFADKVFGQSFQRMYGQDFKSFLPEEVVRDHYFIWDKPTDESNFKIELSEIEYYNPHNTTDIIYVEIRFSSYLISNQEYIVCFINDITKRKKDEIRLQHFADEMEIKVKERVDELAHALAELNLINTNLNIEVEKRKDLELKAYKALEKEREVNQMKSRFISMVSHEFKTPMGGILTSASLIERYIEKENSVKIHKHVRTIKKLVHNLNLILSDFLSIEKFEQGKAMLRPSQFNLKDFIKDIMYELQLIAKEGQETHFEIMGQDTFVYHDREMVRNIVVNLISNAQKYSPADSVIEFYTEILNDQMIFVVADKGIGIPKEEQAHLFDLFFRASNVSTIQGTGVGLNIVKNCVDSMNGKIEFKSEENKGTTFYVTLPMERKHEESFVN